MTQPSSPLVLQPQHEAQLQLRIPKLVWFGVKAHSETASSVALLTNTVRMEISRIFTIVNLVAEHSTPETAFHIPNLTPWFTQSEHKITLVLQELLRVMHLVDEEGLEKGMLNSRTQTASLRDFRISLLNLVRTQTDSYTHAELDEQLNSLYLAAFELGKGLHFINCVDEDLPELLELSLTHDELQKLGKDIVHSLTEKFRSAHEMRMAVMYWMDKDQIAYMSSHMGAHHNWGHRLVMLFSGQRYGKDAENLRKELVHLFTTKDGQAVERRKSDILEQKKMIKSWTRRFSGAL